MAYSIMHDIASQQTYSDSKNNDWDMQDYIMKSVDLVSIKCQLASLTFAMHAKLS